MERHPLSASALQEIYDRPLNIDQYRRNRSTMLKKSYESQILVERMIDRAEGRTVVIQGLIRPGYSPSFEIKEEFGQASGRIAVDMYRDLKEIDHTDLAHNIITNVQHELREEEYARERSVPANSKWG